MALIQCQSKPPPAPPEIDECQLICCSPGFLDFMNSGKGKNTLEKLCQECDCEEWVPEFPENPESGESEESEESKESEESEEPEEPESNDSDEMYVHY